MKIIQKLSTISANLGTLKKTGWNAFNQYAFVEVEDIIQSVNTELVKHNIRYRVEIIDKSFSENFKDIAIHAKAIFEDEEGQIFITEVFVNASDKSDKAGRKVMQMIKKQAFLDTFLITIGEKDADSESPETQKGTKPKPVTDYSTISQEKWPEFMPRIKKAWEGEIISENKNGTILKVSGKHIFLTSEQFKELSNNN